MTFRALVGCLLLPILASAAAAQDMPLSQVLLPGEEWQLLGEGYKFTEGPACDPEGNVYFTDIPESRIYKIDLDGKVTPFAEDTGKTNGLMFGPDGRMYGCRNGDKQIVAYDREGRVTVIAEGVTSNDLVVNSRGDLWFTDPPNGQVWHIPAGGEKRVVARDLKPNGVILTADEGTLVVTDGENPHLWTFRVKKDGGLDSKERYFFPLQIPTSRKTPGSDGLTIDKDGRLYVASAIGVQMFDPTGRLGGTILKPQEKSCSNVCFGGPKFEYLYATCTDKVYRRRTKTAGAPYFTKVKANRQP